MSRKGFLGDWTLRGGGCKAFLWDVVIILMLFAAWVAWGTLEDYLAGLWSK